MLAGCAADVGADGEYADIDVDVEGTASALDGPEEVCTATTFASGGAGVTIVDAGGIKCSFPLPTTQRVFATWAAFGTWAQQNLFATLVTNSSGTVGIRTQVTQYDDALWYGGQPAMLRTVSDPIAAFIGGTSGTVKIGATTYCLDKVSCANSSPNARSYLNLYADPLPALSSTVTACVGTNCQQSETWMTRIPFFNDIGADIEVTRGGGYSHRHYACWSSIICTRRSGGNRLAVSATYLRPAILGGPIEGDAAANNTTRVKIRVTSFATVHVAEDDVDGVCAGQTMAVGVAHTPYVQAETGSGTGTSDPPACPGFAHAI
jgi:hypothetical protein